jgi:hypothetical protein
MTQANDVACGRRPKAARRRCLQIAACHRILGRDVFYAASASSSVDGWGGNALIKAGKFELIVP